MKVDLKACKNPPYGTRQPPSLPSGTMLCKALSNPCELRVPISGLSPFAQIDIMGEGKFFQSLCAQDLGVRLEAQKEPYSSKAWELGACCSRL